MTYSTTLNVNGDIVKYCSETRKAIIEVAAIYRKETGADSIITALDILNNELNLSYCDAVIESNFAAARNVCGLARTIKILMSPYSDSINEDYTRSYRNLTKYQGILEQCIDQEVRDQKRG